MRRTATAVAVSGQYRIASVAETYGSSPLRRCILAWFFTDHAMPGSTARNAASYFLSSASSAQSGSCQITSTSPSGADGARPWRWSHMAFLTKPAPIHPSGKFNALTAPRRCQRSGSARSTAMTCDAASMQRYYRRRRAYGTPGMVLAQKAVFPIGNAHRVSAPTRSRQRRSRAPFFPKPVPDRSFPTLLPGDGEAGKIVPNQWLLSATRTGRLSVPVWVSSDQCFSYGSKRA